MAGHDSTALIRLQQVGGGLRVAASRRGFRLARAETTKKDGPEVADGVSSVRLLRPSSFERTMNDRVKLHHSPDFVDRAYLVFLMNCENYSPNEFAIADGVWLSHLFLSRPYCREPEARSDFRVPTRYPIPYQRLSISCAILEPFLDNSSSHCNQVD